MIATTNGLFVTSVTSTVGGLDMQQETDITLRGSVNPQELLDMSWGNMFPGKVVVKCQWCGQWAARKTSCKHCGGAIE